MDKLDDLELVTLQARYDVLMTMPIEMDTEIGIAIWMQRCDALRADVKRSRFEYFEVART